MSDEEIEARAPILPPACECGADLVPLRCTHCGVHFVGFLCDHRASGCAICALSSRRPAAEACVDEQALNDTIGCLIALFPEEERDEAEHRMLLEINRRTGDELDEVVVDLEHPEGDEPPPAEGEA